MNIARKIISSPKSIGEISSEIELAMFKSFHQDENAQNHSFLIDYRYKKSCNLTAGLDFFPRQMVDSLYIYNPMDVERPCGFYGEIENNKPISKYKILTFISFLNYFNFRDIAKVFESFYDQSLVLTKPSLFNYLYSFDENISKNFKKHFDENLIEKVEQLSSISNINLIKQLLKMPFFTTSFLLNSTNAWKNNGSF